MTMYNEQLKQRFLNELKERGEFLDSSIIMYRNVLRKAEITEKKLNKDVYQFNYAELEDLLFSYNNKTLGAVKVYHLVLKNYINFCISEGYVPSRINWLDNISNLEKFVNQNFNENKFLSREQLDNAIDNTLYNPQDKVKILLLFLGIMGNECEELLSLKVSDVFHDKILIKENEQVIREIYISQKDYQTIREAISQNSYKMNNGKSRADELPLYQTQYVVRIGKLEEGRVPYQSFRTAFGRIKKFLENNNLSPLTIYQSGMLDYAKKLKEKKGKELEKKEWEFIAKEFNTSYKWYYLKELYKNHL